MTWMLGRFGMAERHLQAERGIRMLYKIDDVTVTAGGQVILDHIHFEIRGSDKIAVVGRNGAGKTTLLRLIGGELEPDRDDRRFGPGIFKSRTVTAGMLRQNVFDRPEISLGGYLEQRIKDRGISFQEGLDYEQDFDRSLTRLGFSQADKGRKLGGFSGGQQTKLALLFLFLEKPDILLLDEPTNHLDMDALEWLEEQVRNYEKAVVMVSHDRFFMDQTAQVIYELSRGKLIRYVGNYSQYRKQKLKDLEIQKKAYERQQAEIQRQNDLIRRFKNKPKKAAFARSRKKMLERMPLIPKPETEEGHIFTGEILPERRGNKWVFDCEHLVLGYDQPLLELSFKIRRGQKIGLIGPNGAGKTTFLKTVSGQLAPMDGKYSLGSDISVGYFDQKSAEISSEKTVAEHFHDLFPSLTGKEVYQTLGAYMLGGSRASRRVCDLSGGEKARLVLCELLQSRPNFLVLDEPTNHMDIPAKETLESAFKAYKGTILFVSHDRYFISQVADGLLIFEDKEAAYYPFGYEHYARRRQEQQASGNDLRARMDARDAAMIADLRAVPEAERHRLREIGTQEAYEDWQMRLAREDMEECRVRAEALWNKRCALYEAMDLEAMEEAQRLYEEASARWQDACMHWYDIYLETEPREEENEEDSDT